MAGGAGRAGPRSMTERGFDAVILAGGAARRMGGAAKPDEDVGGRSMLAWVADAVAAAGRIVVVGPRRPVPDGSAARFVGVQEDPPGAGPVPALAAGLTRVRASQVALLAADLPFLRAEHIDRLRAALDAAAGAVLVDDSGRPQWLCGVWRTAPLATALARYDGASLRGLLGPLQPRRVTVPATSRPPWYDCDTPEQLATARRWAATPPGMHHGR